MRADIHKAISTAEEIREKYNPDHISPFPYEKILVDSTVTDLKIFFNAIEENQGEKISGAISYDAGLSSFNILINTNKPKNRQHFTLAHELGHYYLHKELIRQEEIMIDGEGTLDGGRALFRLDTAISSILEIEANNFAANLIMPADLVIQAWEKVGSIEECAKIFNVSIVAMSIRLEKLGVIKEHYGF